MRGVKLAVAFAILATSAAAAFQGEPAGFRGLDWGTPFEFVAAEMMHDQTVGDLTRYHRDGDKLAIGEAELVHIGYEFYKDRFMAATLFSASGALIKAAMIKSFQAQFGPGYQSNRYIENYEWRGPAATITLNCDPVRRSCLALIQSTGILEEYRADRATAAKAAGKDF